MRKLESKNNQYITSGQQKPINFQLKVHIRRIAKHLLTLEVNWVNQMFFPTQFCVLSFT